ncbi:MAG: GNAT family N-acetyltransferase [Mycobacteriales bacterium]|nr:GNAT family N-acetyltransferase [Mycobacteriales bacterium]
MSSTATALDDGITLDVLLRDGSIAQVRLLRPEDRDALTALNERVSLRTRHLRYFSVSDGPGTWYVDKLVHGAEAHATLVAVVDREIVATAGFARSERDPRQADLALLVDDDHQLHGLGALLLEHLATLARHHGVEAFTADVLQENTRMLRLLHGSGFATTGTGAHGTLELTVDLHEMPGLWDAVLRRDRQAEQASLEPVLRPSSVVVVGSTRSGSVADQVYNSLVRTGFTGRLTFVDGRTRLSDLPVTPDLVVVAVPAPGVLATAQDAASRGARGLLVLSAGFAESGAEGAERQAALLRLCRDTGMRLVGPNCLGILNTDPAISLNATFCDAQPRSGSVALVSQSGAVGIAALRHAERRGAGLSLFVSTGNKADVSGNDLLAYLQDDPRTSVIALYLESFGNARTFARLARDVGRTKPIVVVKAGRSASGAQAGQSHTAAAATPEIAIEALLREAGVIRADDLDELFDVLSVLESGRLPRAKRVAVIGNSGGPGVLAADACAGAGLQMAELSPATTQQLLGLLPTGASARNPVDLLATISPADFETAVRLVAADPGVDAVVTIYTPLLRDAETAYAEAIARLQREREDVPVVATFPGLHTPPAALGREGRNAVPFFEFPERAVRALGRAADYVEQRDRGDEPATPTAPEGAALGARLVLTSRAEPQGWLTPSEATSVLEAYGIRCARVVEVHDPEAAVAAADLLHYPVALKAAGTTVVHKADVGGLALDLTTADQVRTAYLDLQRRVGPAMTGAIVQRMHPTSGGLELIAGLTVDPTVGPLLLVGAGGTLTDVLGDQVVRVPPTNRRDALEMLSELRCSRLFEGYRNLPALDLEATVDVLLALACLARDLPEVQELDINPLLVTPHGATGIDVRVRIGTPQHHRELPARSLSS